MRWWSGGSRTLAGGAVGVGAGIAGGIAAVALFAAGASGGPGAGGEPFVTGAHLPPLLTVPGEKVTLRYAILCAPPNGDAASGEPCNGGGDVYIRPGHSGSYTRIPLASGTDSKEGRYYADVPDTIAASPSGFSYYAVLRDEATGETTTLPAGGASAPQDSYPLRNPTVVDLAAHIFGATRHADARVVSASWGDGTGQAGLMGGATLGRIGPSSFDVSADGTVSVLDEMNGRVERWRGGSVAATRVDVPRAIDDIAVGGDGSIYEVDGRSETGETPFLRTFAPDGTFRSKAHIAERTWAQIRADSTGAVVDEHPSEQWMSGSGKKGRAGRPLRDGSQVVVDHTGSGEVRVAHVAAGAVRQAWIVESATPLGEVQLADVSGGRAVLVVHPYTETQDEFEVLVLDGHGTVKRFSVPSAQWAETAPLARFRLVGNSLYQFGSTATGIFVDRFDLGGAQ